MDKLENKISNNFNSNPLFRYLRDLLHPSCQRAPDASKSDCLRIRRLPISGRTLVSSSGPDNFEGDFLLATWRMRRLARPHVHRDARPMQFPVHFLIPGRLSAHRRRHGLRPNRHRGVVRAPSIRTRGGRRFERPQTRLR